MKTLNFVVFRSELNDSVWTEWAPIGAFPCMMTAQGYAQNCKLNDWVERKYKIKELSIDVPALVLEHSI